MSSVPVIIQKRLKRRAAKQRRPTLAAGLSCGLLISLLCVISSVALTFFYVDLTRDLPSPEALSALLEPPRGILLRPTRLYDRSEKYPILTLAYPTTLDPSTNLRRFLPLESSTSAHMPETIVQAIIAADDPGFWSHPGFTFGGFAPESRPTLAQRLVSDLLLWDEPAGLRRDLRERLLAAQITARFGRKKVLEWYLNNAKFGRLVYGVDSASRVYFDKPAEALNLAEAALLVAIAEAPEISPFDAPEVHLERQKRVIGAMLTQGLIRAEQAYEASQSKIHLQEKLDPPPNLAPAFTNLVLEQLSARLSMERIERGGFMIRTSLDYILQIQANCAAQTELKRRQGKEVSTGDPIAEDGSLCEAARLLPTLPLSINPELGELAVKAVVLEPRTGQILAMVGDLAPGLDPAHLPGQSPGTLITPFIYLSAFTRGWSPASLAWDIPAGLSEDVDEAAHVVVPSNAENPLSSSSSIIYHGPVSLRAALANDYQAPAIGLLSQIGPEQVWRTAQQLGLESLQLDVLQRSLNQRSLFVGGEVSLLEIVQAFGAFANGGVLAGHVLETSPSPDAFPPLRPITVLKVEGVDHQIWLDCQDQLVNCSPQARPVLSPQLAYLITHVLSDETARWPSLKHPNPLEIGRPAGAKIGMTGEGSHAWTIGYTPQIVVGVWVGTMEGLLPRSSHIPEGSPPIPNSLSTPGANAQKSIVQSASILWHAVIQFASRNTPALNWAIPEGISTLEVCEPSGMLPTVHCPNVVSEVFISGNEPVVPDTLYRAYQVNHETGRLATVFTPPELVEEQVYLVVPPQAQAWARLTGLPMPPDLYDVISPNPPSSPTVRIESPEMFAYIHGKVRIIGSAAGEDFDFYRLQAGRGLNPQEWLQISSDVQQPVTDGLLGEWDTQNLSGLYALQLLVIRKDQRVDSATIQVTIDNQPPEVTILQPIQRKDASSSANVIVIFEALATDDLALRQVEFYVDQVWIATLNQPPYLIAWRLAPGEHHLLVRAMDMAHNVSEDSLEFEALPPK